VPLGYMLLSVHVRLFYVLCLLIVHDEDLILIIV